MDSVIGVDGDDGFIVRDIVKGVKNLGVKGRVVVGVGICGGVGDWGGLGVEGEGGWIDGVCGGVCWEGFIRGRVCGGVEVGERGWEGVGEVLEKGEWVVGGEGEFGGGGGLVELDDVENEGKKDKRKEKGEVLDKELRRKRDRELVRERIMKVANDEQLHAKQQRVLKVGRDGELGVPRRKNGSGDVDVNGKRRSNDSMATVRTSEDTNGRTGARKLRPLHGNSLSGSRHKSKDSSEALNRHKNRKTDLNSNATDLSSIPDYFLGATDSDSDFEDPLLNLGDLGEDSDDNVSSPGGNMPPLPAPKASRPSPIPVQSKKHVGLTSKKQVPLQRKHSGSGAQEKSVEQRRRLDTNQNTNSVSKKKPNGRPRKHNENQSTHGSSQKRPNGHPRKQDRHQEVHMVNEKRPIERTKKQDVIAVSEKKDFRRPKKQGSTPVKKNIIPSAQASPTSKTADEHTNGVAKPKRLKYIKKAKKDAPSASVAAKIAATAVSVLSRTSRAWDEARSGKKKDDDVESDRSSILSDDIDYAAGKIIIDDFCEHSNGVKKSKDSVRLNNTVLKKRSVAESNGTKKKSRTASTTSTAKPATTGVKKKVSFATPQPQHFATSNRDPRLRAGGKLTKKDYEPGEVPLPVKVSLGDMLNCMTSDKKKFIEEWRWGRVTFEDGKDNEEIVLNMRKVRCGKCFISDVLCEESIVLQLSHERTWKKLRRIRHIGMDLRRKIKRTRGA